MNYSVCVDAVYGGKDFYESLEQVHRLGFRYFEFWRWWDKDLDRLAQEKDRLNLQISSFCTKFISLVDAAKREEYIRGLLETLVAAKKLDCKHIITQVGDELPGVSRWEQRRSLVNGLKACVPYLRAAGVTLLIEPLNTIVDHRGTYLYSSDEGFDIIDEVGDPHVKLLFDIYHQQVTEGHVTARIVKHIGQIGHFHAAGNPGRHELNRGELHYPGIFQAIRQSGYEGVVALEYFPVEDPSAGLKQFLNAITN